MPPGHCQMVARADIVVVVAVAAGVQDLVVECGGGAGEAVRPLLQLEPLTAGGHRPLQPAHRGVGVAVHLAYTENLVSK